MNVLHQAESRRKEAGKTPLFISDRCSFYDHWMKDRWSDFFPQRVRAGGRAQKVLSLGWAGEAQEEGKGGGGEAKKQIIPSYYTGSVVTWEEKT